MTITLTSHFRRPSSTPLVTSLVTCKRSPSCDLLLSRESPCLLLPTQAFVNSTQALGLHNPYHLRSPDLQSLALYAVPHVHSKNPATSLGYAPKPPSRTAIEPRGSSVSGQDNIGATGAFALSSLIPCITTPGFLSHRLPKKTISR